MMLTPVQAQCFEFLMRKAYLNLNKHWQKKILICSDGQMLLGNFFRYDAEGNPIMLCLDSESSEVSLGYENPNSMQYIQIGKRLDASKLNSFKTGVNLDALIFMYVLDTLKSIEELRHSPVRTTVLLFNVTSLTSGKEYPFIHLGDHVNILSVVD